MDQSKIPEKIDSADVFHRARIEENEPEKEAKVVAAEDPDKMWDEPNEKIESDPEYDSRAGA